MKSFLGGGSFQGALCWNGGLGSLIWKNKNKVASKSVNSKWQVKPVSKYIGISFLSAIKYFLQRYVHLTSSAFDLRVKLKISRVQQCNYKILPLTPV